MSWLLFAIGSAFFAGVTAVLAKIGLRDTDSTLATALRTIVVLILAWVVVAITGVADGIGDISGKTLLFLILSGFATGASWLCYFRALQLGPVNQVAVIDKSSIILTIILAFVILQETVSSLAVAGLALLALGTWLMIEMRPDDDRRATSRTTWPLWAVGSAVFASLTSILGKIGIEGVDSNLGTAIRTIVVLLMAWVMVALEGKLPQVRTVSGHDLGWLAASGVATGASWLCYYRALQTGPASVVVPVDKLSILVTVGFAWIVLHERLSRKAALGLLLIVVGTGLLVISQR